MKTTDLERSKRLEELGFNKEGCFWWLRDPISGEAVIYDNRPSSCEPMSVYYCRAITAGEMIEWLLGDYFLTISDEEIQLCTKDGMELVALFSSKDCKTIENALADAVIWVMERKI